MTSMHYTLDQLQSAWPVGERAYYRGEQWDIIAHREAPWSNGLPYLILRRCSDAREVTAYWWDLS